MTEGMGFDFSIVEEREQSWRSLAIGTTHRCAIRTDNPLACGGSNAYGQLGDGTRVSQTNLETVGVATDWQMVSVGEPAPAACATGASSTAGALADSLPFQSTTPIAVQ